MEDQAALQLRTPRRPTNAPWRQPAVGTPGWQPIGLARLVWRLPGLVLIVLSAFLEGAFRSAKQGRNEPAREPGLWLARWSQRTLPLLGVKVKVWGMPPQHGMLVSNHLSYLDMLVYASLQPMVFVAKAEVGRWPVFGPLARLAGSLFIERERRSDVARLNGQLALGIGQGKVIGWFPEGTSSSGHEVHPFHSALLAPAAAQAWPVTPAWISYSLEDGVAANDVCYWGDMTLVPHLLHLMTRKRIQATVVFGDPVSGMTDRKQLAGTLRSHVLQLRAAGLERLPEPA